MIQPRDEATELAVALGEAQQAATIAESKYVSAVQQINVLEEKNKRLGERILQLEIANVNMDNQIQEYRELKDSRKNVIDLNSDRG